MKRLTVIRQVQEFYEVPDDEVISEATFTPYQPGVSITLGLQVMNVVQLDKELQPELIKEK